jgi:hypothetical protein
MSMVVTVLILGLIAGCMVVIGLVAGPSRDPLFVGFIQSANQQINLR